MRDFWTKARPQADADALWDQALQRGVFEGSQLPVRPALIRSDFLREPAAPTADSTELDLVFAPDPTVWDGRFANNAWLQELPKPLTKLTWDNAALVGPKLAQRLGLANEDQVELRYRGAAVLAPVWIVPGQPDATVTVTLGYGRSRAGRIGNGAGFDAYVLRQSDELWHGHGLQVRKTGAKVRLATTQHHFSMEGRRPVRATTLAQFRRDPSLVAADAHRPNPSMYDPVRYDGLCLGDEHQSGCVHRLQCVHDRLPGREQHTDRRQDRSAARARNALDTRRSLLRGRGRAAAHLLPAGAVHALRAGALRGRLPGRSDRPRFGGTELAGVQPLHRHAVLLEQLSLQGAPL